MRFINREVPIDKVARQLDLRLDGTSKIHCWYPERHQNGDRTASVGIRRSNNTVKCFGCDFRPLGPIDLVMDVLGISAADAALWIAARAEVPLIPARQSLEDRNRSRYPSGYDHGLGLLIRSGLWATLSDAAHGIAPVLLEFAERGGPLNGEFTVQMSYAGMARHSGIKSPNAIRRALVALDDIGFVRLSETPVRHSPERATAKYLVTPYSDLLWEAAQALAAQRQTEIAAEVELRRRQRQDRIRLLKEREKSNAHC